METYVSPLLAANPESYRDQHLPAILEANNKIDKPEAEQEAATLFLSQHWFNRAWVFQEAVFSREVIFKFGRLEISMKNFLRLSKTWFMMGLDIDGYSVRGTRGMETLYLIEHGRGECEKNDCPRSELMRNNFLAVLVLALQRFQATLPQDLIYAFLGFQAENQSATINPRYELSAPEAWKDAARRIIESSGSLDIFACVGGSKSGLSIPSWVPDWSHIFPFGRPICAPDFLSAFRACRDKSHLPQPQTSDTLIVRGTVISQIFWISKVDLGPSSSGNVLEDTMKYSVHLEALQALWSSRDTGSLPLPDNHSETLEASLMRTLLADGAFGHAQPLLLPIEIIMQILEREETIRDNRVNRKLNSSKQPALKSSETSEEKDRARIEHDLFQMIREWSLITRNKRVFLTDEYDLGLVPEIARGGDSICLIDGSKVPCVLRKVEGADGTYRLISQCYLDGWMYGEAPPGRMWHEPDELYQLV